MLRIKLLLGSILALSAWIHPASAISAYAELQIENPTFINYEKFHEQPIPETLELLPVKKQAAKPNSSSSYSGRHYSKTEVEELIRKYSAQYGIEAITPICIASKESGFNQFSKNPNSSASGVFQYLSGTWKATDEGRAGLSVWDADANVHAAVKYMAIHRNIRPWVVASKCPPVTKIN